MFGYRREELIDRSIELLVPPRFQESHVRERVDYAANPHARPIHSELELYAMRKDGTEIPVEISLSPIHVAREAFVASAIRDVSERKQAERALRKAEQERFDALGHMAAYVAHQLNTPLTNMALLTAAIGRSGANEKTAEGLRKIDEQRKIAAGIIHELMTFAKITELNRTRQDVRKVVDDAVRQVEMQARGSVSLRKEMPDEPIFMNLDPLRMKEAFVNLLKNALEATNQGTVTIRISNHGPRIRISVVDTGTGMSHETIAQLFRPFFTTKEGSSGTGLGLAFAKNVVMAHGGDIAVESEVGRGSVFTVTLPADAESPSGPSPEASGSEWRKRPNA